MSRLIDADELIRKWDDLTVGRIEFDQVIMCAPTIKVEPVKHGRWIFNRTIESIGDEYCCSICGGNAPYDSARTNYCPHCGAKMDLEVEK